MNFGNPGGLPGRFGAATIEAKRNGIIALVTGATGFIGSHLTRRLVRDGYTVCIWARDHRVAWRLQDIWDQLKVHRVDVADAEAVRLSILKIRPHVVFHLAAFRKAEREAAYWKTAVEVNLKGTLHLLSALLEVRSSLQILVNTGSSEEYGSRPSPFREDLREAPVSPYSASKVAATHCCEVFFRSFSLPVLTLRPFLTYGPAQSTEMFIPSLVQHCLEGKDFPMTEGNQLREFNYVSDIVEAYVIASGKLQAVGEVINVGNGQAYPIGEVAELIVEKMGRPIRLVKGALSKRPGEAALFCDNTKAKEILGWRPRIGLEEGLEKTIEWYRTQEQKRRVTLVPEL